MGNKQQDSHHDQPILNYDRLTVVESSQHAPGQRQSKADHHDLLELQIFKCITLGNQRYQDFEIARADKNVIINKQFENILELEKYISNVIKVSKMLNIVLYDELKFSTTDQSFSTMLSLEIKQFQQVNHNFVKEASLQQKMDLLQFICPFLTRVKNIFICPQFIASSSKRSFYLLNFSYTQQFTAEQMFLGFLRWVFGSDKQFQICLEIEESPSNMPIYLQQIYMCMFQHKSLTIKELEFEIKMIKQKMSFLMNKTDSFYACQFFNKTQKHTAKSDWINMKLKHEIFFYHTKDEHSFVGKLVRKKKKKDITECCITFDHEDLQVLYVPENSKYVVKVSEFQFESSSSISDLEIKYKLPVKFKNCLITRARNGDLFILEQYLHRFQSSTNKLVQETKKISDYIFLTSLRDSTAFIVKLSIDIFRNGIRVFHKNQDIILAHAGDKQKLESISTIRIDIRHVVFCIEVYKGVFLMMASKNMWILDLNFECFFSFATPTQIKRLTATLTKTHTSSPMHTHNINNDNLFVTLKQPFKVEYPCQNGNNALIKDNYLHILGMIEGHPYYLRYSFISRMGAIKLEGYHPLYVESPFIPISMTSSPNKSQEYAFNFHEENSHLYKYGNWIFTGKQFVKVYDFSIRFEKSNYEVRLRTEKLGESLKTHIQRVFSSINPCQQRLNSSLRSSRVVLLYKIFSIYEHLFTNSINHRNISINHIVFSESKELKIHGWSQPPRNWHVSDYKDYLLVCFNVIASSTYEKMSEKIIAKHEAELNNYPVFAEKIIQAFRQFKTIEKRTQIEKNLQVFKSYLEKELTLLLYSVSSSRFILCPEFRTPRLSILSLESSKLKKVTIVQEENSAEEFAFQENDKYVWNEARQRLYIFTATHQFFEIKINMENGISEEKQTLEDYEYLPMNIGLCTFVGTKNDGLFSFGGIKRQVDGKSTYNYKIFKFNWKLLTWEAVGDMPEPYIDPHAVVSACGRFIYLLGGHRGLQSTHLQIIKFDTTTNGCVLYEDYASKAVSSHQSSLLPMRIFHICDQPLLVFMFWYIQQNDYVIRYVTYSSIGFEIELRAKNYSGDNVITQDAVALDSNTIHILRLYGKYTKIAVNKLDNLSVKNETVYAIA